MNTFVGSVLAIVLVFGVGSCAVRCDGIDYSAGERIGVITKVSQKGVFWKTWEADMTLLVEGSAGMAVKAGDFTFSISSEKVAHEVEALARSGKRAVVTYKQYQLRGFSLGDTDYDAVRVAEAR